MIKTILVVDDEYDTSYSIQQGLEYLDAKYHIVCVDSGEECIKLLDKGCIPDIILLDIVMPKMSGWETFDKIKENTSWKEIPIVFLTARVDMMATNVGNFLGDDYIEKPFEIKDLKKRIDNVLICNKESDMKKNRRVTSSHD